MTGDYSLELWNVRGLPTSYSRLVLEVIVRTPRLLSTVRRKHATPGFHAESARGVTLQWSQAKASKAFVRLKVMPVEAPSAGSGAAAAASEATAKVCKSCEVPLQLGAEGLQAALLQLQLQAEPEGGAAAGAAGGGGGGLTAEVEFMVRAKAAAGNSSPSAAAGAATATAPTAPGPTHTATGTAASHPNSASGSPSALLKSSSLHAWGEPAATPAAADPPPAAATTSAATPVRKRSWLLALGLVRGGSAAGGGGGSAEQATVAAHDDAVALARSSMGAVADRAVVDGNGGASSSRRGRSRSAGNALQPLAPSAAVAASAAALGAGPGLLCPSPDGNCEDRPCGQLGHPQPASWSGPRARLPHAMSSGGGGMTAQQAPASTAAAAEPPALPYMSLTGDPTAAVTSAEASLHQPMQLPASESMQSSKRRRLGDLLARLFSPGGQSQSRRVAAIGNAAAAAASPVPPPPPVPATASASTMEGPAPSAALPASLTALGAPAVHPSDPQQQLRGTRQAHPPGLTPLVPPNPELGDIYRIADSNHASDAGVHVAFGGLHHRGSGAGGSSIGFPGAAPPPPPGLDSPDDGKTSPAAGPDRLAIEPPVYDMAAASIASPMSASPSPSAAGCLSWWYGNSTRVRAMPLPPPPPQVAESTAVTAAGLEVQGGGAAAAAVDLSGGAGTSDPSPALANTMAAASLGAAEQPGPAETGADALLPDAAYGNSLEAEVGRVMAFVDGQTGISDDLRATSLSQCQFLLDCLRSPDMFWLVGESLLQLKQEVAFPFDTGSPIPGDPGWFRLVLHPLKHLAPPPASTTGQQQQQQQQQPLPQQQISSLVGGGEGIGGVATLTTSTVVTATAGGMTHGSVPSQPSLSLPRCSPEVLKVRWAAIDQRQAGGANACAAIVLEVAAWCLTAVQRWRAATAAAAAAAGIGASGAYDAAVAAAAAAAADLEAMSGAALEHCIRAGTVIWQGLLAQSEAARVASSTGDFDLEHMLQLGGYSGSLRLAEYAAASLLEGGAAKGGGGEDVGGVASGAEQRADAQKQQQQAQQQPALSLLFPCLPLEVPRQQPQLPPLAGSSSPHVHAELSSQQPVHGAALGESTEFDHLGVLQQQLPMQPVPPQQQVQRRRGSTTIAAAVRRSLRRCSSTGGVPTFASLISCLDQGVYVLGWRGHFATLWLRPGGIVHLIDSLGPRLSADCPLAFVLEFSGRPEFLSFFLARHLARPDDAAADDIAGGNMAALVEVHRLELR